MTLCSDDDDDDPLFDLELEGDEEDFVPVASDKKRKRETGKAAPPSKKARTTGKGTKEKSHKSILHNISKDKGMDGTIHRHVNTKKVVTRLKKECETNCKKILELCHGRDGIIEQHTQLAPLREMIEQYYNPRKVTLVTSGTSNGDGARQKTDEGGGGIKLPSSAFGNTEHEWKMIFTALTKVCALMGSLENRTMEIEDNYIAMILQTFDRMEGGMIPRNMYFKDCNNKQTLKKVLEHMLVDVKVPSDLHKEREKGLRGGNEYHFCPHCREPFSMVTTGKGKDGGPKISKQSLLTSEDRAILDTITCEDNAPIDVSDNVLGPMSRVDGHPRPIPATTPGADVAHLHYMMRHLYDDSGEKTRDPSTLYPPACLHTSTNAISDSAAVLYSRVSQI